jgi:hypothetical protein
MSAEARGAQCEDEQLVLGWLGARQSALHAIVPLTFSKNCLNLIGSSWH